MRPLIVPRWVQIAEESMLEYFGIDLWQLKKSYRDRILVAACDAETMGQPDEAESYIGICVYDLWREIRPRKKKS